MGTYKVTFEGLVRFYVDVEAESPSDAMDVARDNYTLEQLAGGNTIDISQIEECIPVDAI